MVRTVSEPPPDYRLALSFRAQRDTVDIFAYSIEHWGKERARSYLADFERAYDIIRQNPLCGQTHPRLKKTMRRYVVGSHVIIYRVDAKVITVARILHQNMCPSRHL